MNRFKKNKNLYSALSEYADTNMYPFHMPGHKRNTNMLGVSFPFNMDITEIDGFDNLHDANGILRDITDKAKKLFHSEHSYMLINGSTCGILAAVRTVTQYGNEIIIARNCHKAVYNGCALNNLKMHFIYPPQDISSGVCGSVTAESVRNAIKSHPKAKAVVITSPTYEGVISDIESIAQTAHDFGIPLLVDNAHGAHQIFCSFCKGEPVSEGADIVISSLHKTLPSLTQTAIAHINGSLVDAKMFERQLAIFETSSPSYILMASIDNCLDFLLNSKEKFEKYSNRLEDFSDSVKGLRHLTVLCHGNDSVNNHNFYSFDMGKIVICTSGASMNGVELMQILRQKYCLELEMSYPFYAVAMTSVCDTAKGFTRLSYALSEIDSTLTQSCTKSLPLELPMPKHSGINPLELHDNNNISIENIENSIGKVSDRYIYAYPPGVPIIIPGEIVDKETAEYINKLIECGVNVV